MMNTAPLETLELILQRTLKDPQTGHSGDLSGPTGYVCHSIELPWKDNQRGISCVPAGRYPVERVDSPAHGICLELQDVPGRGDCQFHKMNWAAAHGGKPPESKGCIGPVTTLGEKPGIGFGSAQALAKLEALCFPVIDRGGRVFVTILDVPQPTLAGKSTTNSRVRPVKPATSA